MLINFLQNSFRHTLQIRLMDPSLWTVMKVLLPLVITLSLTNAYDRSFIKDTDQSYEKANELQTAIKILLESYCGDDKNCRVIAHFAADLCSTPSKGQECQSDCGFLLEHLWKIGYTPEPDKLKQFVPDRCVQFLAKTNDVEVIDDPKKAKGQEGFESTFDRGETYSIIHIGFESDLDQGLRMGTFERKSVEEPYPSRFCKVTNSNGVVVKTMKQGEVWIEDCNERYGYLNGEIWNVCLQSGHVLKDTSLCETNKESLNRHTELAVAKPIAPPNVYPNPAESLRKATNYIKWICNFVSNDEITLENFHEILFTIPTMLSHLGYAFNYTVLNFNNRNYKYVPDKVLIELQNLERGSALLRKKMEETYFDIFWNGPFASEKIQYRADQLIDLQKVTETFSKIITEPEAFNDLISDFREACHYFNGGDFLDVFAILFQGMNARRIAWQYKYDYKKYVQHLAKPFIAFWFQSAIAAVECASIDKARNTYEDVDYLSLKMEPKLIILYNFVFETEKYIKDHAFREYLEKDLIEYVETHKGHDYYWMVNSLEPVLRTKYDFFDAYAFAVHDVVDVDKHPDDVARAWTCFRCVGAGNSGFYYRDFDDQRIKLSVAMIYTNKLSPNIPSLDVDTDFKEYGQPLLGNFVQHMILENGENKVSTALALNSNYTFQYAGNVCSNPCAQTGAQYHKIADKLNILISN